ncbi:MAG: ureidoglycolate hydrolase [Alphaproteobacteria bacterium]|nr:ureidoglycolate hydrolase [Alphaproteobacteria bacterium]
MDGDAVKLGPKVRTIAVKPATPDALAPYGRFIGRGSGIKPGDSGYYGGKVAISRVAFESDDDTCLSVATIQPRPFELEHIERHYKHTQAFVPLGGKPFVAVFGKPTSGDEPDWDTLEAFRFDGKDGFCMHIGTWHEFPFALEPDTDVIVILRNETTKNLLAKDGGEAHGDDLSKLNIQKRTGAAFRVAV